MSVDTKEISRHHRGRRRRRQKQPSGMAMETIITSCRSCTMNMNDDMTSTVRRKRQRPSSWSVTTGTAPSSSSLILLTTLLTTTTTTTNIKLVSAGVISWTNGPDDKFFCGLKWNDPDCARRQHCPSGRTDECEGTELGIQCFANTQCDTKYGGAAAWTPGMHLITDEPTSAPNEINFESLVEGGLFTPTRSPHTPGSPTLIPTEFPIGAPPPFEGTTSDLPSDHWYCGVGIHDANDRCATHCPNSNECPLGEICYFQTVCDARTHSPTPPPTRRPTGAPTTASPTVSTEPTQTPTLSFPPTVAPTMMGPTFSPTSSPTKRPTHAPLTSLAGGFFCGLDWSDTTSLCKKRCPTGEDTECPSGEFCFAYTGCQEERGYGDDPSKWVAGYNKWGNSIADQVAAMYPIGGKGGSGSSGGNGSGNSSKGGGSGGGAAEEDRPMCYDAEVTITADNWPQETTWKIIDFDTGQDVVIGTNDDLDANVPISKTTCLPSWGCYQFTIYDAGGDGLCCEHGNGMYRVKYGGQVITDGAAFYDSESVEFGCETPEPTKSPTLRPTKSPTEKPVKQEQQSSSSNGNAAASRPSGNSGSSSSMYRCVANPLVEAGYIVKERFCDKFVDCYNEYIVMGDDWFCESDEKCVEAPACGTGPNNASKDASLAGGDAEKPAAPAPNPSPSEPAVPAAESEPDDAQVVMDVSPTKKPTPVPTEDPTSTPLTENPTTVPPTGSPTDIPTLSPTAGPCGGSACATESHCRSKFGFCGPGEYYCMDTAIWTKDCLYVPTKSPVTPEPTTLEPTTLEPTTLEPTTPSPVTLPPVGAALGDMFPSANSGDVTSPPVGAAAFSDIFPSVSSSDVSTPTPTENAISTPKPTEAKTTAATTFSKPSGGVTFSKPSGGGKPKPTGGKGPSGKKPGSSAYKPAGVANPIGSQLAPLIPALQTRSPSNSPTYRPSHSPTTATPTTGAPTTRPTASTAAGELVGLISSNYLTQPPTNWPTPAPTPEPTPEPTKHPVENLDYINLSADSADFVMITNAPTPDPTPKPSRGTMQANSASAGTSSSKGGAEEDNEHSCTGEPCEVESWCRSRYGSCGPGFIYCNANSIWRESCPPMGPRPTRTPTRKPTREPTKGAAFVPSKSSVPAPSGASAPSPPSAPTVVSFPTLPKPTLPTITSVSNSALSDSFLSSAAHSGQTGPAPHGLASSEDTSFETSDSEEEDDDDEDDDDVAKIFLKDSKDEEIEEGNREEREWRAEQNETSSSAGFDQWLDYSDNIKSDGIAVSCSLVVIATSLLFSFTWMSIL